MRYRRFALMMAALAFFSDTQADSPDPRPLADTVKAARKRSIDVSRLVAIRAAAGALMEAKKLEAEQDPRNGLGAQLDELRTQLLARRIAHLNEPLKAASEGMQPAASAPEREDNLVSTQAGLRAKRAALEFKAAQHAGLADAIRKLRELETEIGDIAELPQQERAGHIGDLATRLTPRRVSEFASDLPPQPTLTVRVMPQSRR